MARPERRVDWPLVLGPGAPRPATSAVRALSGIGSVLSVVDELAAYAETDTVLLHRVELGLERLALFVEDLERGVMRGAWGTGARGETTDEHHLVFERTADERWRLQRVPAGTPRWTLLTECLQVAQVADRTLLLGYGWVVISPRPRRRGPAALG